MRLRFYIFVSSITIIFFGSCVPTRYLAENENLLYKIQLEGVEASDAGKITSLYQQRPNRKIFRSTPYLSIYYFGRRFYNPDKIKARIEQKRQKYDQKIEHAGEDSVKTARLLLKRERKLARLNRHLEEGNVLMSFGEPPAIYDTVKTKATLQQITTYLNTIGYFNNKVGHTTEINNKKVKLRINVVENAPYTYSQITYSVPDTAIKAIIDSTRSQSVVKLGQNYNEENLVAERERIESLLKNLGYYEFNSRYITAEVDTSFGHNSTRLNIIIANNADNRPHQAFRLKKVNFIGDANFTRFGLKRDTILFNRIYYLAYVHKISPRILDKKIQIRPGQLYSLNKTLATQRQLGGLEMFRFLNVTYLADDTTNAGLLTANINASPSKRFQESTEGGLSYSANLPGPFVNLRYTARNLFRGAEILELGVRGGIEGQFSALERRSNRLKGIYARQLSGNMGIIFPQFLVPFNANKYFANYNPRTRLNFVYTLIWREEFDRTNLEATYDYIWQKSPRLQFVFTPIDISINDTRNRSPLFVESLRQARLDPNKEQETLYERSLRPAFVPSIDFSILYNSNNYNHTLDASYLRVHVEEAGSLTEPLLRNLAEDKFNLTFFKYGRVNLDYRRYLKLNSTNFFVSRVNFGIAKSWRNDDVLPYDKYFYAGGGTSVRAFLPRRLGPGAYSSPSTIVAGSNRTLTPEQQGDLLMEGSLEYRFNIYSLMNGALFLDAGNIWSLASNEARPGAKFEVNQFYKQIAVGTGIGFRFDFTFLIARVDFATKVYDPAIDLTQPQTSNFVLGKEGFGKIFSTRYSTINLGIGYPF